MKELFRIYELIFLYFIGIIYFILIWFKIEGNSQQNLQYMFFEVAIVVLILNLVREFVMFIRFRKLSTKSIFQYSIYKYLIRLLVVFVFYSLIWFSDYNVSKILIVVTGAISNNILPRPISEGFYTMDSGYILNGIYYKYNNIEKLKLWDSGSLDITYNGKKREFYIILENRGLEYMNI